MSKNCPNCQTEYDDSHNFCMNCGGRLVEKKAEAGTSLNLGRANAISGGVHIDHSQKITSNDTHYHSTVVERTKSDAEIKLDAVNQLRAKAEEIMSERGRIDSVAMSQLRPLALQLGIDDSQFKEIIKEVRSQGRGLGNGLNAANARYLQQAVDAVRSNDMETLSNLAPRIEAMAAISQDDNVQYLHHLSLALLYPIKSMELYECQTEENYWRTFWAIVSYIRTGKVGDATSLLAQFDPLRYEKSEEDQNLLESFFNIMKEDKDGAQEFLDEILGDPSEQIKPLHRAIECKLYEEEGDNLEVKFYMERVMVKSDAVVKSTKKQETKAEESKAKTPEKPAKMESQQDVPVSEEATKLYTHAAKAKGAKRVMLLQKAAEVGSVDAMYDLSDCYYDGEGVEKNMPLSIKWLTKAAELGHTTAAAALGGAYYRGVDGIDQNYNTAEKYLLTAAEKGMVDAQGILAAVYMEMEDYNKALLWGKKAAQSENALGCFMLGRIYSEGLGVDKDDKEAIKWFTKSADNGDADAQNMMGNVYDAGVLVACDKKKAFEYYHKAASQGHVMAMVNLSYCYMQGDGVEQNDDSAIEWSEKAIANGYTDEEGEIFNMIGNAYNNRFDWDNAYENYQKAAELGNTGAWINIGLYYRDGKVVEQDLQLAKQWIQKAIDAGREDAQEILQTPPFINGNEATAEEVDVLQKKTSKKPQKKTTAKSSAESSVPINSKLFNDVDTALKAKDFKGACKLLIDAKKKGDESADIKISEIIQSAIELRKNKKFKAALDMLCPLADKKIVEAQYQAAYIMSDEQNDGEKNKQQNPSKAVQYLNDAVVQEYVPAIVSLGRCLQKGCGVSRDLRKAIDTYKKALDAGYQDVQGITKAISDCEEEMASYPSAQINKVWLTSDGNKKIHGHYSIEAQKLTKKHAIVTCLIVECSTGKSTDEWMWHYEYEFAKGRLKINDFVFQLSLKQLGIDGVNIKNAKLTYRLEVSWDESIWNKVGEYYEAKEEPILITRSEPQTVSVYYESNIFSKDKLIIK